MLNYFSYNTINLNSMPLIDTNDKNLIFNLNIICNYIYYYRGNKINEERIIISPLEGEKSNVMEFSSTHYYDIIKNCFKDEDNRNYIPNYYHFRAFVIYQRY